MTRRFTRQVILVAVLGILAAGCGGDEPSDEARRMLDDPPTPEATAPADGESDAEATTEVAFPVECGDVISFVSVAEIVAVPMRGSRRIYRDDFPNSPRVEQLVCSYGTEVVDDDDEDTEPRERPAVEVFVSAYEDAASAAAQVQTTVDNARVAGREVDEVEIQGQGVITLTSSEATSYVYARGDYTYVVTLARDVVEGPAEPVVLTQLTEQLLSSDAAA